jgi:BTB And C-terminal Kelch
MVSHRSVEALLSEHWPRVSLETVVDVMQLDHLMASEADVVRALLRWGRAQLNHREGRDPKTLGVKVNRESIFSIIP